MTELGGRVTIVTGWDYYLGADPTGIGAGQYDFQTVVSHELGHSLGLGHSTDANSVMFPELATGQVRRGLTGADLAAIEDDGGGAEALYAAVSAAPAAGVTASAVSIAPAWLAPERVALTLAAAATDGPTAGRAASGADEWDLLDTLTRPLLVESAPGDTTGSTPDWAAFELEAVGVGGDSVWW